MASFNGMAQADVYPSDFDDDELTEELESRGYIVMTDLPDEPCYVDVAWNVDRGNLKEALILLEREVPKLRGISRLVE